MDYIDLAKKLGKALVDGTAGYLQEASKSASKNRQFTEEQRDELLQFSDKMKYFRETREGLLIDVDEDYGDWYEQDAELESDNQDFIDDEIQEDYESIQSFTEKDCVKERTSSKSKNTNKPKTVNRSKAVGKQKQDAKSVEKQKDRQRIAEIKKQKQAFRMKIEKAKYAEKSSGKSGWILKGVVTQGGIYEEDGRSITIMHKNGEQSTHRIISVRNHSISDKHYAQKGAYISLFIEASSNEQFSVDDVLCD